PASAPPFRAMRELDAGRQQIGQRIGALDDEDALHGAAREVREHAGKQQPLLRRAVARCLAGREHDGGDHADERSVARSSSTVSVGSPPWSPSLPIRSTTASPLTTAPTIA